MKQFYAVIVAAGRGERAGGDIPKQFRIVHGKPLLLHSVEAFLRFPTLVKLVIVLGEGQREQAIAFLPNNPKILYTQGGASRRESVHAGLKSLETIASDDAPTLIHDAARPFGLDVDGTISALIQALNSEKAAVPTLPIADSMVTNNGGILGQAVDRDDFLRVQTPQAFHFGIIKHAHDIWQADSTEPTDDARMAQHFGHEVATVRGDERLAKMTFAEDFTNNLPERIDVTESSVPPPLSSTTPSSIRMGNGYDVHRFEPGDHIWLCGIKIPHDHGLKGHSDADVGLHALTDAILGALAMGDIGDHFPDTDPEWKGASSDRFLQHAGKLAQAAGYHISNLDVTLICEAPKIKPHRENMRMRIAEVLDVRPDQVSVKATTTEALGFTGRKEGIAAQASALIVAAREQAD